MGTKRSLVWILHDTGYGDDLLLHMNRAFNGKDMRAEAICDSIADACWKSLPIPIEQGLKVVRDRIMSETGIRKPKPSIKFLESFICLANRGQEIARIVQAQVYDVQRIVESWLSDCGVTTDNAGDYEFELVYPYHWQSQLNYRLMDKQGRQVSSLVINLATLPPTSMIEQ